MVARIYTVAFEGAEARRVDVQVQVTSAGRQFFNIVGLAIKEQIVTCDAHYLAHICI